MAVRAALFDIHGNLPALEAVLEDAGREGARRFLLGGDYAAFGAWPAEVLALLDTLADAVWIRGNWERWQQDPEQAPDTPVVQGAAAHVRAALPQARIAALAALPQTVAVETVRLSHASPRSDMDAFTLPAFVTSETAEHDRALLEGTAERLAVFGHTHVQFQRVTAGGVRLVNPGSVGLPWDGDRRAAYALVSPDGTVAFRRVAYDDGAAAAALDAIDQPWAAVTAERLRQARFDVG